MGPQRRAPGGLEAMMPVSRDKVALVPKRNRAGNAAENGPNGVQSFPPKRKEQENRKKKRVFFFLSFCLVVMLCFCLRCDLALHESLLCLLHGYGGDVLCAST